MSEKGPAFYPEEKPESSLVPAPGIDHGQIMADLQEFSGLLNDKGQIDKAKELRHRLEERYGDYIQDQFRIMQPVPDQAADPVGYASWRESRRRMYELAEHDIQVASIVRRLAASPDELVNANRPPTPQRKNRRGYLVDEFGNDEPNEPEMDEFEEMEHDARLATGTEVPLNRQQIIDILHELNGRISQISQEKGMADIAYPDREAGESFSREGKMHYTEANPEHQRLYAEVEAEVARQVQEIRRIMSRYVAMLPIGDREKYSSLYKLDE